MPQEIATILVQILPLVLIFVVFYFLLIRCLLYTSDAADE